MRGTKGVCAAGVAAAALSVASPGDTLAAGLEEQSCRLVFDSLPAEFARCSTLAVPVDPAISDGPTIELFVARIAALSSAPKPDPLLIITGGPGQSTVDFYLQLRAAFEEVRRDRDLILVDQRGTGRSASGFTCDVPDDLALETAGAELERFVDECLAALEHDPRFYTTSVAVQDLERLRSALDLPQWNIYGVSYGTRVAQHYVRRFPARARAVILDGVVPAEVALGPEVAIHAQRALDRVFERCAGDPQCAARFTNLPERFREVLERLETEPVPMPAAAYAGAASAATFGAAHAKALARFMSYSGQTAALLPLLITEASEGNYAPLAGQTNTILRGLPEALSFPMSNAVICTEDVPFMPETIDGLSDTYLGTAIVDALLRVCARWPAGAIDVDFKMPLVTDRPTLLLSGDADPITPPQYAERVIEGGVANSVHVVAAGQGHGLASVGCVSRIMRAFLQIPAPQALDATCLAIEPPVPFFLSARGPAP